MSAAAVMDPMTELDMLHVQVSASSPPPPPPPERYHCDRCGSTLLDVGDDVSEAERDEHAARCRG